MGMWGQEKVQGMRGRWLAGLLLGLGLAGAAQAAGGDAVGRPPAESPLARSAGQFGVQLVLTPDAAAFVRAWNDARTAAPQLPTTGTVRRGGAVSAMLVFHGCAANARGMCDMVVAYTLTTPGGQKLQTGSGVVWSAPVPSGRLQLGRRSATMRFEAVDAPGTYQVGALVTDRVSGRKLALVVPLRVE